MANLANLMVESARARPERPALRLGETVVSYAELDDASARVAGLLRGRGVAGGDRVGIMLPNLTAFPAIYYGVLRAGGVVVPMNPLLKSREVAFYLGDSGARVIFACAAGSSDEAAKGAAEAGAECIVVTPAEFERMLSGQEPETDVVERDGQDTAVILYTSGTTGKPKGAELTHANMTTNARGVASNLFSATADDVIFGGLPLFHSFGQTCGLNTAIGGGRLPHAVASLRPGRPRWRSSQRDRVTIFEGVPTMYVALLQRPDQDSYDTSDAARVRFGRRGAAGGGAARLRGGLRLRHPRGLRAVGDVAGGLVQPPRPGAQAGLDRHTDRGSGVPAHRRRRATTSPTGEVGEIAIRGHNVMKGYWNRPEATAEAIRDGWFRTGDMARRDDDGYYFIVDRKKELIIRGGYNVYPREIEEVLYEHPGGRRGRGDRRARTRPTGEEVGAAVVLKPDAEVTARGAPRLRQGPGGGVQVPAARLVRRCPADGADRQDPQA